MIGGVFLHKDSILFKMNFFSKIGYNLALQLRLKLVPFSLLIFPILWATLLVLTWLDFLKMKTKMSVKRFTITQSYSHTHLENIIIIINIHTLSAWNTSSKIPTVNSRSPTFGINSFRSSFWCNNNPMVSLLSILFSGGRVFIWVDI